MDDHELTPARESLQRLMLSAGLLISCLLACSVPASATAAAIFASPTNTFGQVHGMGLIVVPHAKPSTAALAQVRATAASLPASVDLTPYAMPVGNQGAVGSCAAWSSDYTALGYWENKQGIGGGGIEPMYTYSQVTGGHDNGSSIEGNLSIDTQGVDTQADYWQGNFDYTDFPAAAERANAVNWKLSRYSVLPIQTSSSSTLTQQSIETALAAGDPVVIAIPVYNNFFYVNSTNNGFYSSISGALAGYHAITALGYDSTGLRIENSWGTSWGAGGFATLSWAFVNGYVVDAVSVGSLITGQPVGTIAPAITGTVGEGQTLTATPGSWSPSAGSYAYQWERATATSSNWSLITGATSATYVPGSTDEGQRLRVLVTASNATGPGAAASAATAPISATFPVNQTLPVISGTVSQGQTLSVSPGTWIPAATSSSYQWQRAPQSSSTWSAITGATGATYTSGPSDVNASLRVVVSATNSHGQGVATSAAVGPVRSDAPVNTVPPGVSGTALQGQTLTASIGSWSPAGTSYAYQWQVSGDSGTTWATVAGQTGSTFNTSATAAGVMVRVNVTATSAYGSAVASSPAFGPVLSAAPVSVVRPAISGTAARGAVLSAGTGAWSPVGSSYSYQWQRLTNTSGTWSNISGAVQSTYVVSAADKNSFLRVLVTAHNAYGQATAASVAVGPVKGSAPANLSIPAIVGAVKVASTVTASVGVWAGIGNSYAYQWQRGTSKGFVNIAGATGPNHIVTKADLGTTLRVIVTATNPDGSAAAVGKPTPSVVAISRLSLRARAARAHRAARSRTGRRHKK